MNPDYGFLISILIGSAVLAAVVVPVGTRMLMKLALLLAEALRRHANATERAYRGYVEGWRMDQGGDAED